MLFKENILSAKFWNGTSKRQMVSGMTYLLNGKTLAKSAHDVTLSPLKRQLPSFDAWLRV
jgi:hypothetical protein